MISALLALNEGPRLTSQGMHPLFTVAEIRQAETRLLAETAPDQVMRLAARAVATGARHLLCTPGPESASPAAAPRRVLILAGPGGNGGDGLYTGAFLINEHATSLPHALVLADAVLVTGSAHSPALSAFTQAGGRVIDVAAARADLAHYDLVIDAIAGLGSTRPLDTAIADLFAQLPRTTRVLSVDSPTGLNTDTGAPNGVADACVTADVTVTMGGLRPVHALNPRCGEVVLVDLRPACPDGVQRASFSELLASLADDTARPTGAWQRSLPSALFSGLAHTDSPSGSSCEDGEFIARSTAEVHRLPDLTPGPADDKYTGGVVALCAGSDAYPGAGLLCAGAAVAATPSMVRVVGRPDIVAAHPEVVPHADVASSGRAQAFVIGPGRGDCGAEVAEVLARDVPTLIDADGITALAADPQLLDAVRAHGRIAVTPHDREFERLYTAALPALGPNAAAADWSRGRAVLAAELAAALGCVVLLKGRATIIAQPDGHVHVTNSGNSYAATPGSGDVLAGIAGAWLAREGEDVTHDGIAKALVHACAVHAHAAAIAAATPEGLAPTSASRIAKAVPQATARLIRG